MDVPTAADGRRRNFDPMVPAGQAGLKVKVGLEPVLIVADPKAGAG